MSTIASSGGGDATQAGAGAGISSGAAQSTAGAASSTGTGSIWPETWRDQLAGGDAKARTRLDRFNSPDDIFRSYRALEQRLSSGELRPTLPKDAKPEEVAAWRAEAGIPEKPEGYDLTFEDGLVVGETDKPVIGEFLKIAHAANMHPAQVKGAVKWYYDEIARQTDARAASDKKLGQEAQDALRAKWGDEYRGNMNRVYALFDMGGPAGLKDEVLNGRMADGRPIGSHPAMLEFLAWASRQIDPQGTVVPGKGADVAGSIDSEIQKIEKTMREDNAAYRKDEAMQARYRELLDAKNAAAKRQKAA